MAYGAAEHDGGGGLFNSGGTVFVRDSEIVLNSAGGAAGSGGGVMTLGGRLTLMNTNVDLNTAVRAGGGVEATSGSIVGIEGGALSRNRVGQGLGNRDPGPGDGGGLHLTGDGFMDIRDSAVFGNTASAEGGGLWNSAAGTMSVTDTERDRQHRVR